jgi:hypothetical protein
VGRLLGLGSLRTFLATATAGVAVSFGYGWGGEALRYWLDHRQIGTGMRVAVALVALVVVVVLVRVIRHFARRTAAPSDASVTPPKPTGAG